MRQICCAVLALTLAHPGAALAESDRAARRSGRGGGAPGGA